MPIGSNQALTRLHVVALDLDALTTLAINNELTHGAKVADVGDASAMTTWLTVQLCERVEAWRLGLIETLGTRSTTQAVAIFRQVDEALSIDLRRNTARNSVFSQMAGLLDAPIPGTLSDSLADALHRGASRLSVSAGPDVDVETPDVDVGTNGQTFAKELRVGRASALEEIQRRLRLAIDNPLNVLHDQFALLRDASAARIRIAKTAISGTPGLAVSPEAVWGPVGTLVNAMGQATLDRRLWLAQTTAFFLDPEGWTQMAAASKQNSSRFASITWIDELAAEAGAILTPDTGMPGRE